MVEVKMFVQIGHVRWLPISMETILGDLRCGIDQECIDARALSDVTFPKDEM